MVDPHDADALASDPLLRDLIRTLRPSLKAVEVERVSSSDGLRHRVRFDLLTMQDVEVAYIDPDKIREADVHLRRAGLGG